MSPALAQSQRPESDVSQDSGTSIVLLKKNVLSGAVVSWRALCR